MVKDETSPVYVYISIERRFTEPLGVFIGLRSLQK